MDFAKMSDSEVSARVFVNVKKMQDILLDELDQLECDGELGSEAYKNKAAKLFVLRQVADPTHFETL